MAGQPCYDPVTGKPEYSPTNADKPVWRGICPCSTTIVYSFNEPLTGCVAGHCDGFDGDRTLTFLADYPDTDWCTWQEVISADWSVTLLVFYDGTAELEFDGSSPAEICWRGLCAAFNCTGESVFLWSLPGTCSGPASITVTGT